MKTYTIPDWVWERIEQGRLSFRALRVLAYLKRRAVKTPGGWGVLVTYTKIASDLGTNRSNVTHGARALRDVGAMRPVRTPQGVRLVLVDRPPLDDIEVSERTLTSADNG